MGSGIGGKGVGGYSSLKSIVNPKLTVLPHKFPNLRCTLRPACTFPRSGSRFSEVCSRSVHIF